MAEKRRSVHGKAGVKEELGDSPCRPLDSRPSQEAQCSVPDAEPAPGGWAGRAHSMAPSGVHSPPPPAWPAELCSSPPPNELLSPFPDTGMGTLLLVF